MTINNIIIANQVTVVNNQDTNTRSDDSKFEIQKEKWSVKKTQSIFIACMLLEIGEERRYDRMINCSEVITYQYCKDCNSYQISKANLCRDRFCPICSWRLALKRFVVMSDIFDEYYKKNNDVEYYFVTLTCKNCICYELNDTMAKMSTAWDRLLKRRGIKSNVNGYAKSIEYTYNAEKNTIHPHYHIIFAIKKDSVVTDEYIIKLWLELATKWGLVVDRKGQNGQKILMSDSDKQGMRNDEQDRSDILSSILEVFKYNIKSSDTLKMSLEVFRELTKQISKKRLISFGVGFKKMIQERNIDLDTIDNDEVIKCKKCNSRNLDKILLLWALGENRYKEIKL